MKYLIGFSFLVAASTFAFSQQFQFKDSKVEMIPVNQPLYIIDGKIMPGLVRSKIDSTKMVSPIAEINAADIEKIEVLKHLNGEAVYGEAGKNGVVKITLKKPR